MQEKERIAVLETEIKFIREDIGDIKSSVESSNTILSSLSGQLINKKDFDGICKRVEETEKVVARAKIYVTVGVAITSALFALFAWIGDKLWELWMKNYLNCTLHGSELRVTMKWNM
jgi:hypothetical protein